MIERFPHDHSYLQRTKLRYVNLPNVLSDGKRDRTARVPGYVMVYLGDAVDLVFLVDGEPATAARVGAGGRAVVSVRSVLERANAATERADVAFHGAPLDQIRAMLATLGSEPVLAAPELDATQPGRLFTLLHERRFDGVLEIREERAANYVVLKAGLPRAAYLIDRQADEPVPESLGRLFEPARARALTAAAYAPLDGFPVQAPVALIQLYGRILGDAVTAVAEVTGPDAAISHFRESLERTRPDHAALATYALDSDGQIEGDPLDPPDALTSAIAAWLGDALLAAERVGPIEAGSILTQITRGHRFALEAQDFFGRLPLRLDG